MKESDNLTCQVIYDEIEELCDKINFAGDATYSYLADIAHGGPDSDPNRIIAFGEQIKRILESAAVSLKIVADQIETGHDNTNK